MPKGGREEKSKRFEFMKTIPIGFVVRQSSDVDTLVGPTISLEYGEYGIIIYPCRAQICIM